MKKKIALFGGTFDPIHLGHLNLAIQLQEIHQLDEVLFCPANFSPHKESNQPVAAAELRSSMVGLAIDPIKKFSLLKYELEKKGPSFTIDSVRMLLEAYPDSQFFLILGELTGLEKWKDIEELLALIQPLIGRRKEKLDLPADLTGLSDGARKILQKGMTPISMMEISSTNIRERLKQKKYCGHLLPEKVLNFIYEHKLYN
ncbi:MAG TPA: nicotinate (nicotinamide) nucleotide adenylyltransferase [Rhabdochlamydiaceae bacterium]|nr:nicotinate (nicotinamide) nucleotide adenylyltransferase [Rhabdochlamydiaceae bacterium]